MSDAKVNSTSPVPTGGPLSDSIKGQMTIEPKTSK